MIASQVAPSLASLSRHPHGQQPRKLRDSCIHCANSKVKCNKEKPVCSRCVRRRLVCEYKVSRRTGRGSRASNEIPEAHSATTATPPGLDSSNINSNPNIRTNSVTSVSSQTPLLTPTATDPTAHPSPEHYAPQTPELWHSILSPSARGPDIGDLTSIMPMGANVGDIFFPVIPSPQFPPCDLDPLAPPGIGESLSGTDQPFFPAEVSSDSKRTDFLGTVPQPPMCCLTIVLDALTSLFPNASTTCKQPGSESSPGKIRTFESVISDNKQIIDTINGVLDCPCSQDEYIISIVYLVVFKVMSWYVAAARDRTSSPDDNLGWGNDPSYHSSGACGSSIEEQVVCLSSISGSYCIEGVDSSRMAAQLVLSELHQVQRLVNVLSSRLESIRLRSCVPSGGISGSTGITNSGDMPFLAGMRISPLSGPASSQIEEDLRKRLRAVSSETIGILRRP